MYEPIVIDPPGFNLKVAWDSCHPGPYVREDGEPDLAAAFGADPGLVACPRCRRDHWAWGQRQRCTDPTCGFEYPTVRYDRFSSGRKARGGTDAAPSAPERPDCPYYMHGWRNPHLTYDDADTLDWPAVVAAFRPWEPLPAEAEAIAAEEARGDCVHYRGTRESVCAAGVHMRALVGGENLGWCTRLPCLKSLRSRANGPVAVCARFQTKTRAEVERDERETQELIAQAERLGPLRQQIKREQKGKTARGVAECPICRGKMRWSHAAYNGHVWMTCETKECVQVIE